MSSKTIYYVYAYLREDATPYYIGKGSGFRYRHHHKGIEVPANCANIVFLEKNLTNLGALALERRMIRWYGRIDKGSGILLNRTDGGEGMVGLKHSDETRAKMSAAQKGKHNWQASDETRRKMSESKLAGSDDWKNKLRLAKLGRKRGPMSEEQKRKISDSRNRRFSGKNITDIVDLDK